MIQMPPLMKGTAMKFYSALLAALCAAALFAQTMPPMPRLSPPPASRSERMGGGEMMIQRMLNDRNLMKKLGVDGETVAKIDEANKAVNERLRTAKTRIDELSAKQVELAGTILNTPGADPQPLMNIIAEIGQLRIVTAQEMTRRMLILRDHLTPEQMKTLKKRFDEQRNIRREQMLNFGERGPRRNSDSRPPFGPLKEIAPPPASPGTAQPPAPEAQQVPRP